MADPTKNQSSLVGLTSEEAARRHRQFGANEIVPSRIESFFTDLKEALLDPMGLMLLGLACLYLLIGDKVDALVLALAYIPVTAVDVALHLRARSALKAVNNSIPLTAKVLRDERIQEIPAKNVVPGDLILFTEGQALPADGVVIESEHLCINEAALTGESVPVDKLPGKTFHAGTWVLTGRGTGRVESIGKQTKFGKIATLLAETSGLQTPLQRKVNKLVHRVMLVALVLAVSLFAIELWRGNEWIQSLITAMTFAMAAIPEEFPLVFTLYLSLGAWRLSRHGVLVKSLPSVESLGSVDVICSDKTGTLTEGRFELESVTPLAPQSNQEQLWRCALMACEPVIVDSMEEAIAGKGAAFHHLLNGWTLQYDYPFDPAGKHMSHVWRNEKGEHLVAMKGAIEGVLEHCQISAAEKQRLSELTTRFAGQGKRLLGLAYREGAAEGQRLVDERGLTFLAILVYSDPVRKSAKDAIAVCQRAGIEIKMLTGDHPLTAHAVADEIGIEHSHDLLFTGSELAEMPELKRREAYQKGAIFSRVMPEQKHELVQTLQALGKVVAMTGDGINDAPALKKADIGISMGAQATDLARSTAKMVLIQNDFRGIVEAVFEGRQIMGNLRRSFAYLVSFHIPVVLLAFLPPLFGWGDLLLPIHIVLLELIVHPVSAFAFENLLQKGIGREKSLLSAKRLFEASLSGLLLSLGCLVLFQGTVQSLGAEHARSQALLTVLFGNIAFVIVESWPSATRRGLGIITALLVLILILNQAPSVGEIFHLVSLPMTDLSIALLTGILASLPSFALRARSKWCRSGT